MNIIICVKQIQNINNAKDIRSSNKRLNNFVDIVAIKEGLRLKEIFKGKLTAISMGPSSNIDNMRDILAMGVDKAILISDSIFSGADTYSTALTLYKAIIKIGEFDIIITGNQSTDGETGQVGPSLAEFLQIPHVTNIKKVNDVIANESITLTKNVERGSVKINTRMPVLISVNDRINIPAVPTILDKIRLKNKEVIVWNKMDLRLTSNNCGQTGSLTHVIGSKKMKSTKKSNIMYYSKSKENIKKMVSELIGELI